MPPRTATTLNRRPTPPPQLRNPLHAISATAELLSATLEEQAEAGLPLPRAGGSDGGKDRAGATRRSSDGYTLVSDATSRGGAGVASATVAFSPVKAVPVEGGSGEAAGTVLGGGGDDDSLTEHAPLLALSAQELPQRRSGGGSGGGHGGLGGNAGGGGGSKALQMLAADVRTIATEAQAMHRLLNDLLDLHR
jgi:signal transduction histidine kinase